MGVKGLWQLLEPVGKPVTLESLQGKVLAVDASILMNQAIKGMRDGSGNPVPNAHLFVLFHRLCKLLFYRVKPVFVFDGGVPVLKKKTLVRAYLEEMQTNLNREQRTLQSERARQARASAEVSTEMLNESQELLRLFGVPFLVSPMEAEAQCAFLDMTGQTDGTITDDSDVFLFGGRRVYKNIFNQNKHAECYTCEDIDKGLALSRSKMIKLAFVTGSDYTEGIQGLGAVSAMEVLHEFSQDGFAALKELR
ncbi:predicted protein [Nematostella vectensis]|uniref:Uncharacterized protein n=1 Tax=Nematostella vectensis TaxID=45351 RepID=A7RTI4_NEMVE|nr:predicted protein [Nematostella vectensis]|eukprot:XP_001637332.1 predicted protein [Nematostella vectensis]